MDATAPGSRSVSQELHVLTSSRRPHLQGSRPHKRKKVDHEVSEASAVVACFSQARTLDATGNGNPFRLPQCSEAGEDDLLGCVNHPTHSGTLPGQTALATAAYDDASLRASQAYRDLQQQDDTTSPNLSGNDYISTGSMPACSSQAIAESSFIRSPDSAPTAPSQPLVEGSFAPATLSPSFAGIGGRQAAFNSIYYQKQEWPGDGPFNTLTSETQYLPLPTPHSVPHTVPHPLPQFQSQAVLPSCIEGGLYYKEEGFLISSHDALGEVNETPRSFTDAAAVHEQITTALSAHTLDGALDPPSTHEQISLYRHHHQQGALCEQTQGSIGVETVVATLYSSPARALSVARYSPQLDSESKLEQFQEEILATPSSAPNIEPSMGGGEYPPGCHQMVENEEFCQVVGHLQDGTRVPQDSNVIELTVSMETSAPPFEYSHHPITHSQLHVGTTAWSGSPGMIEEALQELGGSIRGVEASEISPHTKVGTAQEIRFPSGQKRRAQMSPSHRQQTAETRRRKACTRCRNQKMRCEIDPSDESGPCVGCKSFCKTSKKTLHLMPCFRGKITDVVLFRSGGLGLTRRWTGTEMRDVGNRVDPSDIRTIHFTQGLCKMAIEVKVVAFEPMATDVTARFWMLRESDSDVRKKKELATYCLFNIQQTADWFERYVHYHAVPAVIEQKTGPVKIAGQRSAFLGVIEKTYLAAVRHYDDLKVQLSEAPNADVHREIRLLHNLFTFWFARRHTTGSAYISGAETLGMKPETKDDTYPLFGKVSLPRMIVAQFDSINHTRLLSRYGKRLLADLEALMMRNQPRWWFAIYVCLFILLREASWLSEDRYRHARQNHGKKLRYSIPSFVQNLQEGCNNLLQHWHYYNCKPWPDPAAPWERHKSLLSDLSSEQYDLVMETMADSAVQKQLAVWKRYKDENGHVERLAPQSLPEGETAYQGSQTQYDWDHPFYWVSQLFEDQWRAHPTYQSEL